MKTFYVGEVNKILQVLLCSPPLSASVYPGQQQCSTGLLCFTKKLRPARGVGGSQIVCSSPSPAPSESFIMFCY